MFVDVYFIFFVVVGQVAWFEDGVVQFGGNEVVVGSSFGFVVVFYGVGLFFWFKVGIEGIDYNELVDVFGFGFVNGFDGVFFIDQFGFFFLVLVLEFVVNIMVLMF